MITAFDLWVANTVAELGGNKAQCLRDLRRKFTITNMTNYRKTAVRYAVPLPNGKFKTPDRVIRFTNSLTGRIGCLVKGAKSSAKAKNLEFSLTKQEVRELWEEQQGRCLYTGWEMATDSHNPKLVSLERKNTEAGYFKDNCALVAWSANRAKSVLSLPDFIFLCEAVVKKNSRT
jgi:hypothetical protein